jgi:hypothetical protein
MAKRISKWLAIGAAVVALGTGTASAADSTADREALVQQKRAEVARAGQDSRDGAPAVDPAGSDARAPCDCCAR